MSWFSKEDVEVRHIDTLPLLFLGSSHKALATTGYQDARTSLSPTRSELTLSNAVRQEVL